MIRTRASAIDNSLGYRLSRGHESPRQARVVWSETLHNGDVIASEGGVPTRRSEWESRWRMPVSLTQTRAPISTHHNCRLGRIDAQIQKSGR